MSETPIEASSGPSLENILWQAMDRWAQEPALLDIEEFSERIADAFQGDVVAETFIDRFFRGIESGGGQPARDMAAAVVRSTSARMHIYEFDLAELEYVIIEEKDKVVIVSDFGQFSLENNDLVRGALEQTIVPAQPGERAGIRSEGGGEPRAYFVRADGEIAAVDVKKVGRVLQQFLVKQVSAPAIDSPSKRLFPFEPTRRRLTAVQEERILREADPRMRRALPPPPPRLRAGGAETAATAPPPAGAETAVFLLLPDGSLARPAMGSATRWQEMVSEWVARAAAAAPLAAQPVRASGEQRFIVQAGRVVALFERGPRDLPGSVGQRAQVRADAVSQVRADAAPIRILGDDELAKALAEGAMVVPGRAQSQTNLYWVQPEQAFAPRESDLTQAAPQKTLVEGQPLQLGQITGDPWADWALAGGGPVEPAVLLAAARGRRTSGLFRAALDRDDGTVAPPGLAQQLRGMRGGEIMLRGARVIAFRNADGSLVMQREAGPIRLAATDRADVVAVGGERKGPIAIRTGAIPARALQALQMALERTATAGGYKLPLASLLSAPDALEVGASLQLDSGDARLTNVRLADSPRLFDGPGGQVARLVLSMPFPNSGELHVGEDLSEALQRYLAVPVMPATSSGATWIGGGAALGAIGGGALALRSGGGGDDVAPVNFGSLHTQASQRAQDALVTLNIPDVQRLLAGSATHSALPTLLAKALEQGGSWTPGPGAPVPIAIREFALKGPFDEMPAELVVAVPAPTQQRRPLNPGEDEIVIPMPLWAQMGRGRLSATDQIMASPLAPEGHAPPLGSYRLVAPFHAPADYTNGAPAHTDGIIQLAGPTGLNLGVEPGGQVLATSTVSRILLARVPVDDGQTVVGRMGRISAPDDSAPRQITTGGSVTGSVPTQTLAAPSIDAGNLPRMPAAPMMGAANSALKMSDDVQSRTLPARPSISSGSPALSGSSAGSGNFVASAAAAGRSDAASTMSGAGSRQTLVTGQGSTFQAQLSQGGTNTAQAAASAGSTASSTAQSMASSASGSSPDLSSYIRGLPIGSWSGARRGQPGFTRWSYGSRDVPFEQNVGGVNLSALAKPIYPSLPTSLRFRYAGAPLWWSDSAAGAAAATSSDDTETSRSVRSGLSAANSAAQMWRSIFVASPQWGGESNEERSAAHDQVLGELRGLDPLRGAALATGGAVAGGAGAETVYMAINRSGAAGPTTASAAARARASSVEMSIVAAIPSRPPPLETSGSSGGGEVPHARGKHHPGHDHHAMGENSKDAERTSHSKIEGSVDAIAQRIYHRIRRRIQSDRERFGG
jgi:hypothetical protein